MATSYRIYSNDGAGGPIDYGTVLATVSGLTWSTSALAAGTWRFGVRAFDTVSGLEESNVDAVVEIVIETGTLADVSAVPRAPVALTAVATAGGTAHVAWTYPLNRGVQPAGFHVYLGSPTPDYGSPVATVDARPLGDPRYSIDLAGLVDGTTYQIAVRAYAATGLEEQNTAVVSATADSTPPANVQFLTAT